MPEVSIIIPAYNVEKYLKKCIYSVLNQTFTDFEVLLIDDGSTDRTPQICDLLAEKDKRIRVFHKRNGGLSDARNHGLDRITGKYVAFIDSDDYIPSDYIEYLVNLLKNNKAQISMVMGQKLLENERPHKSTASCEEKISSKEAIRRMLMGLNASHSSWGKLFKASLWKKMRFPKGQNYEDYATTYHIFSTAKTVAYSNAQKYYYIQRKDSIMHSVCSEKTLSVLDVSDSVSDYLLKKYPSFKIEILVLQLRTYLSNLRVILNYNEILFPEYQKRITDFVKKNAFSALTSRKMPLKEKVKIISLLSGKKIFLKIYNTYSNDKSCI